MWHDPLPSVAEPSARGLSPWLEAARGGLIGRLRELLEGDDMLLHSSDTFGFTALHWAAARDHVKTLRWLLEQGVRVDAPSRAGGHTALHVACHHGYTDSAACLLGGGAAPSLRSMMGMTPLHHACVACNVRLTQLLLDAGASLLPYDPKRRKATHPPAIAARIAASATGVQRQRESCAVRRLLEAEEKRISEWFRAARALSYERLEELLGSGGARIDAVHDETGTTALMLAASAARPDVVKLLIGAGANAKMTDANGETVLHKVAHASKWRKIDVSSLITPLIGAGARPDARNAEGWTPLDVATNLRMQREASEGWEGRGGILAISILENIQVVEDALRRLIAARARMRRWRLAGMIAGRLVSWRARAAERAYAPGGAGYSAAAHEWDAHVGSKRGRDE